jgi:hypothetical protein
MIEEILEEELAREAAPRELWDRVRHPRAAAAGTLKLRRLMWAMAAAAVVMASGMWFTRVTAEARAIEAATKAPEPLEFRSADAAEVRAWVKNHSGLDVPLAAELSPRVVLEGARPVGGAVEIAYRVDGRRVALLVSKAGALDFRKTSHGVLNRDRRAVSWSMRGERFTLACASPSDMEAACTLCHAADGIPHGT